MAGSDCGRIVQMLPDYVQGRLGQELESEVREHIAVCDCCRAEAAAVRVELEALRECAYSEVPPELYTGVMSSVEKYENSKKQKNHSGLYFAFVRYGSLAAALLIIFICSVFVMPRVLTDRDIVGNVSGDGYEFYTSQVSEPAADSNVIGNGDVSQTPSFPEAEDGTHDSAVGGGTGNEQLPDNVPDAPSPSEPTPPGDAESDMESDRVDDAPTAPIQQRVLCVYRMRRDMAEELGTPYRQSADGGVLFYIYSEYLNGKCTQLGERLSATEHFAETEKAEELIRNMDAEYQRHIYIAVYVTG